MWHIEKGSGNKTYFEQTRQLLPPTMMTVLLKLKLKSTGILVFLVFFLF
jgi:hypothetical protein